MQVDENILGKLEYEKALEGKRHWIDYQFKVKDARIPREK